VCNIGQTVYFVEAHAPGDKYQNVLEFKTAVEQWLEQHHIKYKWHGHETRRLGGVTSYRYCGVCYDEKAAVFFTLRWG